MTCCKMKALTIAMIATLGIGPGTTPAALAQAASGHSGHGAHAGHGAGTMAAMTPSTMAFMEANTRMHADMDIPFSGDADVDFARGMIPHHEGAVAMAQILLAHGTDPDLRALAQSIIDSQSAEIAMLRGWLEKNTKKTGVAGHSGHSGQMQH